MGSQVRDQSTRKRESPWIHPEAIAALVQNGRIENKDIPALIRLYVLSQIEWHRKAGRDYWEGNGTIAKALGVPLHMVENAIRRSAAISRDNGGKGRGADKRFAVTEPAKPSGNTSQIHGCHQSDRRVETVKLTGATSQIDGCHRNRRQRNKDKVTQKEGREEEPASLPVVNSSSFRSEEEAGEIRKKYDLVDPHGLSQAYYAFLSKCTGYPLNASEKDIGYAAKCLDALSGNNLRRPDVISAWLVWWCMARPKKRDRTWWFTSFSGSWGGFREQAIALAEAADEVERERQEAERQRQREQEEAEHRTRREAFVAGLPTEATIASAIEAVPDPETFGHNDSLRWMSDLVKSTGLKLVMASSPYEYSYIEIAYRAVGYDPVKMILKTKQLFLRIADDVLGQLHGDESRDKLVPTKIKWDVFCRHFGQDEGRARVHPHRIPDGARDYRRTASDGGRDDNDGTIP